MIWLRGWSAVSTQSHKRTGIRNIRYACIAGGYSIGLETALSLRSLNVKTVRAGFKCVSVKAHSGMPSQQRLSQKSFGIPGVLCETRINIHNVIPCFTCINNTGELSCTGHVFQVWDSRITCSVTRTRRSCGKDKSSPYVRPSI